MKIDYNYYLGYLKDNKFYPLGPFNSNGKLKPVLSNNYNNLQERCLFTGINEADVSDELRKHFEYESYVNRNKTKMVLTPLYKTMLAELPSGDFIKRGYFHMSDVTNYETSDGHDVSFRAYKSPSVFAEMLKNEMQTKNTQSGYDYDGEPVHQSIASEYMYFAYPDCSSVHYEIFIIRTIAEILRKNENISANDIVILVTENKRDDNSPFVI